MYRSFLINRPWATWLAVWCFVVAAYVLSSNKQRWDSTWTLHVAHSIWFDGDIDLSEFADLIGDEDYHVTTVHGHLVSTFPDGAAFAAAPIVGLLDGIQGALSSDPDRAPMQGWIQSDVQEAIASVMVAATCVLLGMIALQMDLSWPRSIFIVLLAAFGTPFWSTMSRALWSHTAASLFLVLAILCLIKARTPRRTSIRPWIFAGVFLGLSYVSRPTAALPIVAFTVLAFVWDPRRALWLTGGGLIIAVLFAAHNLRSYGTVLPWYYLPGRLEATSTFREALLGNLISPSRGFWLYVPIWISSVIGLVRMRRSYPGIAAVVAVVSVAHWIAVSWFDYWWGGYAFGPRLMSDLTPLLMLGMIGYVQSVHRPVSKAQRVSVLAALLLVVASVAIHFAGANGGGTNEWNSTPVDIQDDPSRLWDWSDPQMLRRPGVPLAQVGQHS